MFVPVPHSDTIDKHISTPFIIKNGAYNNNNKKIIIIIIILINNIIKSIYVHRYRYNNYAHESGLFMINKKY